MTIRLKYHCPDHPDRAPFCAIGDYTPCRECYQKFRAKTVAVSKDHKADIGAKSISYINPNDLYKHNDNALCIKIDE
ncbi:hypothetical protein ACQ9LF_06325 [Anaerohalosphaeraceae bacterium U12dextr]